MPVLSIKKFKERPRKTQWGILLVGGLILSAIGLFLFISFFRGDGVQLDFDLPKSVVVGVPTVISVTLQNNSKTPLENSSIELVLPTGVVFESNEDQLRALREMSVVDVGETVKEDFSIIVKDKNLDRVLHAVALYTPKNLGQKLRLTATKEILVDTPVDISITAPEAVKGGDRFDWSVDLRNKSDREWNVVLEADIPDSISTNFNSGESLSLPVNSEKKRTFSGLATLEEGKEEKIVIRVVKVNGTDGQKTVLAEKDFSIKGDKSSLGMSISLNDSPSGITVVSGAELKYDIGLSNLSSNEIKNVVLAAELDSKMIDVTTISSKEGMRVSGNKITWDQSVLPRLASLKPGDKTVISFYVNAKEAFAMRNYSDKNYSVKIKASVEGDMNGQTVINVLSLENKVAGEANLTQKLFYRDAASGILNSGPFPPRVGQATEYVLRMNLATVGADMENVVVRSKLSPGVRATGQNRTNIGTISESDGYLIWTIGKLPAGAGVIKDDPQAVIQLSYLPSPADMGGYGSVITESDITANDTYTLRQYNNYFGEISTELKDDPTVRSGDGVVRN